MEVSVAGINLDWQSRSLLAYVVCLICIVKGINK